ncbi:putative glycosyl hydrolase YcjT [Clostridia bacterium]|nr:putative glycosyl hydrolase YcjT [Clostridia bacterium]
MLWTLSVEGFSAENIADNGNRFLTGNGYMGVRGTLDEFTKAQQAAVNLAGLYDKVGDGWREPLNAPNPLYTWVEVDGKRIGLPETPAPEHSQTMDFRGGLVSRRTVFDGLTIESERFVSMDDAHVLGLRYSVTSGFDVKLHAEIDGDVWDIYGPHYERVEYENTDGILTCTAYVQNGRDIVAVARRNFENGTTLESLCCVYTTRDCADPLAAALEHAKRLTSYDALKAASLKRWEELWAVGAVEIDGDDEAERAVNYSLYHLNCIAPREGETLSIPARGLSGQTYKGAIFWDTEIFMLDYFLLTRPEVARSLVRYRIETLPGALEKAKQYGYEGAFYAWESQEGGFDACSDYNVTDVFTGRPVRTFFRDKQVHISAAVVWAITRYVRATGDTELLKNGGAQTVSECARFYRSLLVKPLARERYELRDVIGPDEYHERVDNNAYTNRMAAFVFDAALELADDEQIRDAREKLYIPEPNADGLIEQFDGYFKMEDATPEQVRARLKDPREYWGGTGGVAGDTQVIKQSDVVTMLEMFHGDYDAEILRKNWEFYNPRTEHGSSLSACMYALLACRFGEPDLAYPLFMKSAAAEIRGGGKQWAGLVYIGGTHPAAAGGAWKTLVYGFAGLELENGVPRVSPRLPAGWKRVKFNVVVRGVVYGVEAAREQA